MKFSIEKFKIAELISQADSVIEQKTISIIFSNLLLEALDDNKVFISATDSNTYFKASDNAKVIQPGRILVNAKKLFDIIKVVPEVELNFETIDNKSLNIYSEDRSFEFELKTMDPSEFTISFDIIFENRFELDIDLFKNMIQKTIFSTSEEMDKQFSTIGVLIEKKEDKINMIATDKRRLAIYKSFDELPDLLSIVPKKLLQLILRVRTSENKCQISITEKKFSFQIGNIQYMSNLLEPKFPNYRTLVQENFEYQAIIDTDLFSQNVKMASAMFSANDDTIILKLSKNQMSISTLEHELGKSRVNFEIDYQNENIEISLAYKNIIDFIRVIETKKFKLQFNNPQKALFFSQVEEKEGLYKYLYITVPVKL
jgi:DNA polymerase-3 subunit beta